MKKQASNKQGVSQEFYVAELLRYYNNPNNDAPYRRKLIDLWTSIDKPEYQKAVRIALK